MKSVLGTIFFLLLFYCNSLTAQVIYTDIVPDAVVTTSGTGIVYPVTITHDTIANKDIQFRILAFANEIKASCINCQLLTDGGGYYPQALNNSIVVSSTSTVWASPDTTFGSGLWDGTTGNWNNVTDKYIGFRFLKNSHYRYGWIRLDVGESASVFSAKLKDYAYNADPDVQILTGQKTTSISNITPDDIGVNVEHYTLHITGMKQTAFLSIADIQGKEVLAKQLQVDETISVNGLPAGVYIVRLFVGGCSFARRICLTP